MTFWRASRPSCRKGPMTCACSAAVVKENAAWSPGRISPTGRSAVLLSIPRPTTVVVRLLHVSITQNRNPAHAMHHRKFLWHCHAIEHSGGLAPAGLGVVRSLRHVAGPTLPGRLDTGAQRADQVG